MADVKIIEIKKDSYDLKAAEYELWPNGSGTEEVAIETENDTESDEIKEGDKDANT